MARVDDLVERHRLRARLDRAVAGLPESPATPVAVVDLDAFDANAADLVRRGGGTPLRVASKSLRVPALLRRALATPGFAGVLCYTLREALDLVEDGVTDDAVVAYPTVDRPALARLRESPAARAAVTVMVDHPDHLALLTETGADEQHPLRVALDVDAGLALGDRRIGPQRSPLRDTGSVVGLARRVLDSPGLRLVGVMTYEGQVAGVPDDVPGEPARSRAVRWFKRSSLHQLTTRRAAVAAALADLVELEFWNAGGSGSVAESAADPVVTEVAAGSGLLVPGLFDHYRSFRPRPAAFVGLPVTRRPGPGTVTVHGGGMIASGPPSASRQPVPWAPPGLALTGAEGAGEVQTPLTGRGTGLLRTGALVWFRHAKSGEPFAHVNQVHLLHGPAITEVVPSYRGLGRAYG